MGAQIRARWGRVCKGPTGPGTSARPLSASSAWLQRGFSDMAVEQLAVCGGGIEIVMHKDMMALLMMPFVMLVAVNFTEHVPHTRAFSDATVIPILQLRRLKHREVNWLVQGHRFERGPIAKAG